DMQPFSRREIEDGVYLSIDDAADWAPGHIVRARYQAHDLVAPPEVIQDEFHRSRGAVGGRESDMQALPSVLREAEMDDSAGPGLQSQNVFASLYGCVTHGRCSLLSLAAAPAPADRTYSVLGLPGFVGDPKSSTVVPCFNQGRSGSNP